MTSISPTITGREIHAISLVGFGHFLSHFYMFGLTPLFVVIGAEFEVSYLQRWNSDGLQHCVGRSPDADGSPGG